MVRQTLACTAILCGAVAIPTARQGSPLDIATALARMGEQVERFLNRAQSLICIETVQVQPLSPGFSPDQPGRTVESELRVSWSPLTYRPDALPEAQMQRNVLRINGGKPRKNDPKNCTTPEQNASEPQPLSMLLPERQPEYIFSLAGMGKLDNQPALMLDFEHKVRAKVDVTEIENNEDCVGFSVEGGTSGRVWIHPETFDVLRLDQRLRGLVEVPLPKRAVRRTNGTSHWTVERMDVSMRFKSLSFQDPTESLMLPVSVSMLSVTRGSGTPRVRTTTTYSQYQRFVTGAKVVKE